jgi:hypothetical protein
MKNLLIPIEESEFLPSVLQSAVLVARRFGSYLEGLHVRPDFAGSIAASGMGAPYVIEEFRREDWEGIQRAHKTFGAFMREREIPVDTEAHAGDPWSAFRAEAPPGDEFIGQHARLFDLTIVGQPSRGATPPRMAVLETVLFDSGRPILVAPPSPPPRIGETIVIAWNASTETARTVAFARPLLEQADRVVVLTVEGGLVVGPSGDEMARSHAGRDPGTGPSCTAAPRHWRNHPGADSPARRRSPDQGRLYSEPVAPDDIGRSHQSYPGHDQRAGLHGPLRRYWRADRLRRSLFLDASG